MVAADVETLRKTESALTSWWLGVTGKPLLLPLLLGAVPIGAALAVPAVGALLLLLPAVLPLLCLITVGVLASLPWWLHLPLSGKPLMVPLFLLATPVLGLCGVVTLMWLPALLLCLLPLFCLLPVLVLTFLPLLFFVNTALAVPILGYSVVPAWLSISWTWPLPDLTPLHHKYKAALVTLQS